MPSSIVAELQTNLGIGESGKKDETGHVKREPALKQQTGAVRSDQAPPKPKAERPGLIRRFIRFVFGTTGPADSLPEIPKALSPEQFAASSVAVAAATKRILARRMREMESVDTVAAPQAEPPQAVTSETRIKEVLRVTLIDGEIHHVLAEDLARAENDQSSWVPLCDAAGNLLSEHEPSSPPSLLLSSIRTSRIDAVPDLTSPADSGDDGLPKSSFVTAEDNSQAFGEQCQKL